MKESSQWTNGNMALVVWRPNKLTEINKRLYNLFYENARVYILYTQGTKLQTKPKVETWKRHKNVERTSKEG